LSGARFVGLRFVVQDSEHDKMCSDCLNTQENGMSISESISLITSNKWKIWRGINSAIILFAFFIPWAVMDSGSNIIFTGFQMIPFYQSVTRFEVLVQERDWTERIRVAMVMIPYFLGLYALLIYSVLNVLAAAFTDKLVDKKIWNILVFCLLMLGIINLLHLSGLDHGAWRNLSSALWGYWLVLIGLVSSIVLELSYFLSKRT
jgi:hypothetical protein